MRRPVSEQPNLVLVSSAGKPAAVEGLLASLNLPLTTPVTTASSLTEAAEILVNSGLEGLLLTGKAGREELASLLCDRELLARLPDGVALLDAENTIRWANPAMVAWCTC